MATSLTHDGLEILALSKEEAVHVISLLAAQLGETAVRRHYAGAAPDFVVHDENGGNGRRVALTVKPDAPQENRRS